jgi:hypothetical protein
MSGTIHALDDSVEETHCSTDANVLLTSHGRTLAFMLPLLLSNVDKADSLTLCPDYATPIVAELRDGAWVCLRWGEAWL